MEELFKAPAQRKYYLEKDLDQLSPVEAQAMEHEAEAEAQRIFTRFRGREQYAMLVARKLQNLAKAKVTNKLTVEG